MIPCRYGSYVIRRTSAARRCGMAQAKAAARPRRKVTSRRVPPGYAVAGALAVLALSLDIADAARPTTPDAAIRQLARRHGALPLIVDRRPCLTRGGEPENSSAAGPAYLKTLWPAFAAMHFNTVIAPVYWNLIEPREGRCLVLPPGTFSIRDVHLYRY